MQSKQFQYINLFVLLLTAFLGNHLIAQPFTTVLPKNNVMSADSTINFQWNSVAGYNSYKLEISDNSNFTTYTHTGNTISTNTDSHKFTTFGIYFWRIKAYSISNDSIVSNTNKIELFSPLNISGLQAWFNPDYGITHVNGKITQWGDISGLNRTATQSDTTKAPTLTLNSFNGHPIIQFDGINDALNIQDSLNINSASFIIAWNGNESTFSNNKTIISSKGATEGEFFFIGFTGTSSIYSNCYFGNSIYINKAKTLNLSPLNKFKIISGFKPNPISFSGTKRLCIGHDDYTFPWKGLIPELILYNNPSMDTAKLSKLNDYFYAKYAPPVNLGYDINVNYGFCDTLISANASHLKSHIWNTGDTTSTIRVNKSGLYWVQTIDMFGFTSRDSIQVTYSSVKQISDTAICLMDSAIINHNIGSPYNYNWSNGQTSSRFSTSDAGIYQLSITDNNLCVFTDTFNIIIDSLPTKLWLGNDTLICFSNPIGYQFLNYIPLDGLSTGYKYLWNTGDTTATTSITSTGNYLLEISNLRGCIARDTTFVTLQGIPPSTNFVLSADSLCTGDTLSFSDITAGILFSRLWNIGEGIPTSDSTFSHVYNTPGNYTIELTTTALNGCPKVASKTFKVNPSPTVNFTTTPACIGLATLFTNQSTPGVNDSIIDNSWNFNDFASGTSNTSTLHNPEHQYSNAGSFTPQITITTRKGCIAKKTQSLNVVSTATPPSPFTLVSPQNNQIISDSSITFKWNQSDNSYFYTLQIATDANFANILFQTNRLTSTQYTHHFSSFGVYYWRVITQNICGDEFPSSVQNFELFSPNQITGMQAWFNPDYGITQVNGKITQWTDISGFNRTATQSDTSKSPKLILNAFNEHGNIQFDGVNDALNIQDSLNLNSAIFLTAWNGNESTFSNNKTIISSKGASDGEFFFLGFIGTSSIYSNCYFGNSIYVNKNKTLNLNPLNKFKTISGFNANPISYFGIKKLRIGHDDYTFPWKGYIPEIILYNNPAMDSTTLAKLTDYFYAKYAPPVSLGYDIKIPYKLCDTVISAQANHFTNYLWSTGETTSSIHVSRSGSYWVRTTNIFGQQSSDTVEVYFAAHRTLPDTTICFGDTYQYNWPPISNYTLNWSNGNSGSTFTESQGGSYIAILTDTLGCSYKDTFNLFVDSLALRMSLGNDTSYCSGNTLNYQLNNYTLTNPQFLWSTGSTSATALVDSTHAYWLQITNPRGCVARDTVLINVRGKAPVVSFTAPGKCLGETTPFSDLSYTTDGSNLVSWQWNFGDGNNSTNQNPTHNYALPGIYPISLTVTSDSVCSNSNTIPTVVYSLPSANFSPITGCNNTPIQFNDQSQTFDGYTLNYFTWNFGDTQSGGNNQSNAQSPAHQFDTSGVYLVKLKIESNVGCTDSISKIITIKKAPQANFIYSNTCEGQTTWFSDSTITETWNPITARLWLFDDGNSSTNISTLKKYDESGNYPVSYIIQTLNGCADTVNKTVSVYNIPTADFTSNSICKNEPLILESSSIVQNDIISYVRWKIATDRVYTGSPVQLYIDSAATYLVELIVKTPHECGDTITKNIIIKPIPQSQFTYQYDEQSIGYNIQFINTSIGGSTYEWQGPTGTFSTLQNPVYDFVASGTYPILLVTTNNVSCSDSATSNILVSSPIMDIAVSDLKITSVGNYQQAQVNLINISNRNITDLWITLQLNNQQIRERYSGMIRPGEITPFHFNTQIFIPNGETLEFGCVRIESPLFTQETTFDNNQVCITLGDEYSVVKLFPNPASDLIQLWLSSPNESTSNIRVLTTKGSEVITWNNQTLLKGITQLKLPLTELSNGLYILEVEFNNKVERMKFNIIR